MEIFKKSSFTYLFATLLITLPSPSFSLDLILPDTGQVICYDWTDAMECCPDEGEDFYGQDGSYPINPPYLTDNQDGTVTDNLTDLVWEQKTEENETYTYTHSAAITYCDNLILGAFDDWRVPDRKEYSSILNYGRASPSIDTDYFPHYTTGEAYYWTTSEYHGDSTQVWSIFMPFGLIDKSPKTGDPLPLEKVRCVRGNTLPASSYTDNSDGTVTDTVTGLMWEQKTDDSGIQDKDNIYTWKDALAYCENLFLGGASDWRLPNTKELERLVDLGNSNPAIDTTYFPNTNYTPNENDGLYWTGTTCSKCHMRKAFATDFSDGKLNYRNKPLNYDYHEHYVRCVRNSGSDPDGDGVYPNDNCPYIYNPGQENNDGDELGNVCDNCPDVTNSGQEDADCDNIGNACDNCTDTPNGSSGGTCTSGTISDSCTIAGENTHECGTDGFCSMNHEDTYPPDGNDIGDACDCEGDFDCDTDVDGDDTTTFLEDLGRNVWYFECTFDNQCKGDFDCDGDVDGDDTTKFLEDLGRNTWFNQCPSCVIGDWCSY